MKICSKCLMDITDPTITFDDQGICNHCHAYDKKIREFVVSGNEGALTAQRIVRHIKDSMGKDAKYNCIIGVSGGVDSSYLAYLVKEQYHLNPIAVHFDNGWNTDIAVSNVKRVLEKLNIDLFTYVIDWEEFRDLQLSFLASSTPDCEIPTDHAIVAILNQIALRFNIPFVISGANARTESHVPSAWSQGHWDWRYIKSVHKMFGMIPLKTYPHINLFDLMKVKWVRLLNYLDYDKEEAKTFLLKYMGWEDYGWKHHESIYTRFYQGYYLPLKFGYDKRKSHLSSLICSGIITREQAFTILHHMDFYPLEQVRADKAYVCKKLGIQPTTLEGFINAPRRRYEDYPNNSRILRSSWFQKIYQKRTRIDLQK